MTVRRTLPRCGFPSDASYSLLFSDGLSTVGGGATNGPSHPVFVLSGDPRADHARLRAVARADRRRLLQSPANDRRRRAAAARTASAVAPFGRCRPQCRCRSRAIRRAGGHRRPCTHCRAAARGRRAHDAALRLAGPAAARDANGRVATPFDFAQGRPSSSKATGLVEQLWAQQRLATLGVDPEANHDDLVRLGQRFSIVTPGTSLLVLETLDQYLQHDVTPPVTSPELRAAFLQRHDQERVSKTARQRDKTARVVAMWENRVAWWSREFDYARNFRFDGAEIRQSGPISRRGTSRSGRSVPARLLPLQRAPAAAPERVASPAAAGARARALTSDMSVSVSCAVAHHQCLHRRGRPPRRSRSGRATHRDQGLESRHAVFAIAARSRERCVPPVSGRA